MQAYRGPEVMRISLIKATNRKWEDKSESHQVCGRVTRRAWLTIDATPRILSRQLSTPATTLNIVEGVYSRKPDDS